MQISYTLIVALMYVTILSFGLAGLLTSISSLIRKNNGIRVAAVHFHWILILLIFHFNMAWHAVYLTDVESWTYIGFILIVIGPILGYFTTSLLTPNAPNDDTMDGLIEEYFNIRYQVLILFILLQGWMLLADSILGRGFVGSAVVNIALIAMTSFLLTSKNYKLHQIGIGAIWFLLVSGIILRSLHLIK